MIRSPSPPRSRKADRSRSGRPGAYPPPPPPPHLRPIARALIRWFREHARDLPWRRTRDPYAIWISEVMLQQTQVKTVLSYWERWMKALPTVQALANADPAAVLKLWEGLGYYRRARNLQSAARCLLQHHGGRLPRDHAALLALPGIGPYTAGAIASIAFNQPTPILDGNLVRVLARLFCLQDNPVLVRTRTRLWTLATALVQHAAALAASAGRPRTERHPTRLPLRNADTCSHLNQALMELGATLCTPHTPQCERCPVRAWCQGFKAGCATSLPRLPPRPATLHRHEVALVIEHAGRFLVRQRPEHALNARLWEFPTVTLPPSPRAGTAQAGCGRPAPPVASPAGGSPPDWITVRRAVARHYPGLILSRSPPVCVLHHSITRHRIALRVLRADLDSSMAVSGSSVEPAGDRAVGGAKSGWRWATLGELDTLAFAGAHCKIRARLEAG